jgi:hypothetical protein
MADLGRRGVLDAAKTDPVGFVRGRHGLVVSGRILDEASGPVGLGNKTMRIDQFATRSRTGHSDRR